MGVVDRIRTAAGVLTPAERKVADEVVGDPQMIAFGTVAEVAKRAGVSGASVVRLAARLGYDGFVELQEAVQGEMADRLRPAVERIRDVPPGDVLGRARATSLRSVQGTLEGIDPATFELAVGLLADPARTVGVIAGDAGAGIAAHAADELTMLRPGVSSVGGTRVAVGRALARVGEGDVILALDLRRYDRWVLDAVEVALDAGAELVALTDGPLSPLARRASALIVVEAEGIGPFDSYVGALAALSALVAGVADALRDAATSDLDRVEQTWRALDALTDG